MHAELKSFLQAVRERSTPVVPLEDGRRALALALEIVAAIREHGKKVDLAGIARQLELPGCPRQAAEGGCRHMNLFMSLPFCSTPLIYICLHT